MGKIATEQRRIVAKVDKLMAICDESETELTAATDTRRALHEALTSVA